MFGDLMGNMKEQQEAVQKELAAKQVVGDAGDGAVKVTCNGLRQVLDISIDKAKLNWDDQEEVEDLILEAVNRAMEQSAALEQEAASNSIKNILPPGMDGLSGLFG